MSKIFLYDTTLRDGTQGEGFELSVPEKLMLAEKLDGFGVSYIEGGWPGSNPRDESFFKEAASLRLKGAKLTAFGATRRFDQTCDADRSIQALLSAGTPAVTVFGKSSAFHVQNVLGIGPGNNLELISDSVRYLKARTDEVIFDAEHFFDGAREDENYAFEVLRAAVEGGADYIVLCDTNGGSLPSYVTKMVDKAARLFECPVGIHTHNDSELAVANSVAAVESGATMVQGTINGLGERCGNANLISLIPALQVKLGHHCVPAESLCGLTDLAHTVDELTNHIPMPSQAYVGRRAFAHKGGVHVNAVMKDSRSYEHLPPESVGNHRRILVSDLAGRSNIVMKARDFGIELDPEHPFTSRVLERIKALEFDGYQFEGAEASLKLLMEEARGNRHEYFSVKEATVTTSVTSEGSEAARAEAERSYARVVIGVGERSYESAAKGNGPLHALGSAFREILEKSYPCVGSLRLTDYKVRILNSGMGMASTVRVLIRASNGRESWGTVGVSTNVVEASWRALVDAFEYILAKEGVVPTKWAEKPLEFKGEEMVECQA
ncbi:MAG: citramalate synthase [Myxococcota bacterium]|nr:citramalate synthase [Myxococcota bacterium]